MAETAVSALVVSDYDHTATRGSKEINEQSDSEPVMLAGMDKVLDNSRRLRQAWQEREKKDGVVRWFSPFDEGATRPTFETEELCRKHMDETAAARIAKAKLEKQPEANYTPQRIFVSPKRTLNDFVLPEHRARMANAMKAAQDVQHLGRLARAEAQQEITAGVVINMIESQAIAMLPRMSDKELKEATRKATFHGKRRLTKAALAECAKRGLVVIV